MIKCKVIHYGQNNPESDYIMNDIKLESVDEECDLCVNFTRSAHSKEGTLIWLIAC